MAVAKLAEQLLPVPEITGSNVPFLLNSLEKSIPKTELDKKRPGIAYLIVIYKISLSCDVMSKERHLEPSIASSFFRLRQNFLAREILTFQRSILKTD